MDRIETNNHNFEHWRSSLEAFLGEPYRWDLPDERVMYTDDDKDMFVCRNNVLQHIVSIMELATTTPDSQLSPEGVADIKSLMKTIVRIAQERGVQKKTTEDMEGIRAALEQAIEVLRK